MFFLHFEYLYVLLGGGANEGNENFDDILLYQDDGWKTSDYMNVPRQYHAVSTIKFDDACKI